MKNQAVTKSIFSFDFILKNWFQLIIIGTCLYILFSKNMSVTLNFNSPFEQKEKIEISPQPIQEEKEIFTVETKKIAAQQKNLNKFEIPFLSSKSASIDYLKGLESVGEDKVLDYLKRFAQVAVSERRKYGVPASITLANALLHSQAGQSKDAQNSNNHFDIKKNGKTEYFESAWSSFRGHSKYVTSGTFKSLRQLSNTDYKAWAKGLQNAGYNNDSNLASQLISTIEQFNLYELDK